MHILWVVSVQNNRYDQSLHHSLPAMLYSAWSACWSALPDNSTVFYNRSVRRPLNNNWTSVAHCPYQAYRTSCRIHVHGDMQLYVAAVSSVPPFDPII